MLSSIFKIRGRRRKKKPAEKEQRNMGRARSRKEQNRFAASNSSSILPTEGYALRPSSSSLAAPAAPGDPFFQRGRCLVSFRRSLNSFLPERRGSKSARTGALRVWIDGRPIMRLNLNGIIASRALEQRPAYSRMRYMYMRERLSRGLVGMSAYV